MKALRTRGVFFSTLPLTLACALVLGACSAPAVEDGEEEEGLIIGGDGDAASGDGDGSGPGDGDGTGPGDGDGSSGPGDGDGSGPGDGDGDVSPGDGDGGEVFVTETGTQQSLAGVNQKCSDSKVGAPVLRRLTQGEEAASLKGVFGLGDDFSVKLSADPTSHLGFSNDASTLVVGGATARELLKTAEEVADLVAAGLDSLLPCSAAAADRACASEFLSSYGKRLFRRPLTEAEVTRYADYHESVAGRSDFATGIKWMTVSLIQSPHAFYRSEIGVDAGDGTRQLDGYELASELSYMMTGTSPDEALLTKAEAGELSDPAVRLAEAERLLSQDPGDERNLAGVRGFFVEWLKYRTVTGKSRDVDPNFSEVTSQAMVQETREFLEALVFGDKGSFADLMTANFTVLDKTLSDHYGYGGVADSTFARVEKPAINGRGVLAQGSVLAMTSHQNATSPTLRGLLVSERFFCKERPPVPANVPSIETASEGKEPKTTREKYENNHLEQVVCATCHLDFEPFGYLFGHFDEVGKYRADENGETIDTAVDNAPMTDGSVIALADLDALSSLVDTNTNIQSCVSGLFTAYMFSGGGGANCLAEDARQKAIAGEISIYDYLKSFVETPHFSSRK